MLQDCRHWLLLPNPTREVADPGPAPWAQVSRLETLDLLVEQPGNIPSAFNI